MKKYLDEMTKEELIHLAMQECVLLELTFDKEKIMKKLEQKGYERIKETGSLPKKEKVSAEEKEIYLDEENENIEKKGGYEDMKEDLKLKGTEVIEEETQVEEVDFSVESIFPYRSRSYYRNYPNRKLMRSVIRIHRRRRRRKDSFQEISFNYKDIDEEQIKKRETETAINRSKFEKGTDYENKSKEEAIYFDKAYLPSSYFVDEVVLMPKNPTTLFVYWEIRDDTFARLSENNHVLDNVVIKLMKDGHEYRKIIRHERIGSHYITEVDASQSYEALIGYEDQYGNFSEVAHSQEAIVPSDKLSDNFDLFSFDGMIKSLTSIGLLSLLLNYSVRYVLIMFFIISSPLAFLSLINYSTNWIFKAWCKSLFSLLVIQILLPLIFIVIFSIDINNKILFIGSIYAMTKMNDYVRELFGGITSDFSHNFQTQFLRR